MLVEKDATVPNSLALPSIASFAVKVESKDEISKVDHFAKNKSDSEWQEIICRRTYRKIGIYQRKRGWKNQTLAKQRPYSH